MVAQRVSRIPNITAPRGLYPFNVRPSHNHPDQEDLHVSQLTNHQGVTESIFLEAMEAMGVKADRPCVPKSVMFVDERLEDAGAHPIIVSLPFFLGNMSSQVPDVQVDIQSETGSSTKVERIHAKYLVGADGKNSRTREKENVIQ